MNSLEFSEQTLPVDFDGSANLDQLQEVSVGTHLEYPDGSVPMVAKAGSGRMSPVRARTMKEYDQQLAELKKENFNLKLRIYFLEERMQQKFDGDGEKLFKTNIELKVEVASLKEELIEKQDLLKKASNALETISTQHELELKQTRDSASQDISADSIKTQLEELTKELHTCQLQLQGKDDEFNRARRQLEDSHTKLQELLTVNRQLDAAYKRSEERGQELESRLDQGVLIPSAEGIPEAIAEKNNVIGQLRSQIKTKELIIEQLEEETKEMQQALEDKVQNLQKEVAEKEEQLQYKKFDYGDTDGSVGPGGTSESANGDNHTRQTRDTDLEMEEVSHDLPDKDTMIGTLERKLADLQKINSQHEENALKRDKAIQGLSKALQHKERECHSLGGRLDGRDGELSVLKEQVHKAHMHKYQEIENLQQESSSREEKVADLEVTNREKIRENERLQKSLSHREAEVSRLNAQLEKADEVLRQREDTMQDLREALQTEKQKNLEKAGSLDNQYKALLDDAQRQINNQEKMVQRLSKSLQEKDKQLQNYMGMLEAQEPVHESRESIMGSLRQQIVDKEKEIEDAAHDKYLKMGEKDSEIRQLKMALRERDHDIERANQMLLTTEETIDTLETEAKEKDHTMKQLAEALKSSQKSLEEVNERNNRVMQEKEAIVQKLNGSLAKKDKSLQEAIRQSPSASDATIQYLQQRLAEKENLLQEVMTERSRAADNHAQATDQLLKKLQSKDDEIKDANFQMKEEVSSLTRQLQNLYSEVNKKDYDFQTLENRASWAEEQQQEMLDKMRAALNDKNLTIEALVESGREKDRLFLQLQGMCPDQQAAQVTAQLAHVQEVKDQVVRLQNELQNKEGLIARLRMAAERCSPKPGIKCRQPLEDFQTDIAEQTEYDDLHRSEVDESVIHLKLEIEHLRDKIDRPGSPKRNQTMGSDGNMQLGELEREQLQETGDLSDALQAERDIYLKLKQDQGGSDRNGTFDVELGAIQSLRKQLEQGVQNNNLLRSQLEQQLRGTDHQLPNNGEDADSISELRRQVESLQNQLEDSSRWTCSLEARLNQQQTQTRGGGVGGTESDAVRASVECGQKESSSGYNNSYFPSFQNLPDAGQLIPSDDELGKMKPEQLQMLIQKLRDELKHPGIHYEKHEQEQHFLKMSSVGDDDLSATTEGNALKSRPAAFITDMSDRAEEVHTLQTQLSHTENINDLLKRQIEFNTKTNGSAPGFNPELIVQMAQEIERLKEELESAHLKSQSTESLNKKQGRKSHIPTLQRNGTPLKVPSCNTDNREKSPKRKDLNDLKMQTMMLQGKLASTEATVRCQAEKMKYYRGLLEDAGLMDKSPKRSHSESNLIVMDFQDRKPVPSQVTRRRSRSATALEINSCLQSRSPTGELSANSDLKPQNLSNFTNFGQSHNVKELKDHICQLKVQLASCKTDRQLSHEPCNDKNPTITAHVSSPDPLQTEVNSLRGKLAEVQTANKVLRSHLDKGKGPSLTYLQQILEAYRYDLASLQVQLRESRGVSGLLQQRLEELSDFLEELLHQNDHGEVDVIDITPQRVSSLKQKLNETRSMLADLTVNLTAAGEDETEVSRLEGSVTAGQLGQVDSQSHFEDLRDKYDIAVFRIQELEVQLEVMSKENETKSKKKEQVMLELEKEAQEIQQRNSELMSKNSQLQKLHAEQVQKVKSVETDTHLLKNKLEKLQSERGALVRQVDSLKSDCEQLQEELLQRTTNAAGEQAALQQQIKEEEKYANNLKDMLQDTKLQRETLISSQERLTREIVDKKTTIQKLIEQLQEVGEKQGLKSIHPRGQGEHYLGRNLSDGESLQSLRSIERGRHQTGSSTIYVQPSFGSPGEIAENSSIIDDSKASTRGDTSKSTLEDNTNPCPDRVDFSKYISRVAEKSASEEVPGPQTDDVRHLLVRDLGKQIGAISGDTLFPSTSASERASQLTSEPHDLELEEKYKSEICHLLGEIEILRLQLKEQMECNENLKGELCIYERLNSLTSKHVQNAPANNERSDEQLTLDEHLNEIRLLRQRLEDTVSRNDHLREQLEEQLAKARNGDISNIYGEKDMLASGGPRNNQGEFYIRQRQVQQNDNGMEHMQREVNRLQTELDSRKEELHYKQIQVVDLQSAVKKLESKDQILDMEKGAIMIERDNAKKDAKRLRNEVTRLHDQLQENAELNKTLKLELSVLGQVSAVSNLVNPGQSGGLNISLLMEEIRQLRLQLEKTIENNNMLRLKLEECSRNTQSGSYSDINIHHLYGSTEANREIRGSSLRAEELALGSCGMTCSHSLERATSLPTARNSPSVSLYGTSSQPGKPSYCPPLYPGLISPACENMRYSIYDTNRPPSFKDTTPASNLPDSPPPTTEGMVKSRVGADIRSLYAICEIDDYELLKKEIAESNIIFTSMSAVIKERLKIFKHSSPSQSLEYSTLRNLSVNLDNLRVLVGEEQRLIALFWINSLPQRDAGGHFIDAKMSKENQALRIDLVKMTRTYSVVKKDLKAANEKLEAINRKKAQVGRSIIKQLTKTEEVIRKAGNNLEKAHKGQEGTFSS